MEKSSKRNYRPWEIEPKWQKIWREKKIFQPDLKRAKKPFYNLMMFPYPSGEGLHVGNMYAFTGADIYGRFKRMQGFSVFEPIGLDGFGIHSENYAIKLGRHPRDVAKETEKNFYRQLEAIGNAYAWENILETYNPDYYKWTQWIFIQMFKHGLAYRAKAPVNWCPSCKTVLADEQVISGRCERCSTEVEPKKLEQWFFKITAYAEKLLKNLEWIDWSERVKIGQRNWIGRSEGALIKFSIFNSQFSIETFTTRPDTLFGATFMVLAPENSLVEKLTAKKYQKEVGGYVKAAIKKTEIQRIAEGRVKTGVFIGSYCINPANNQKIPVWVADYVVTSYGTGAIMGVPAHDQRDFEFAKKYNLPIIEVISGGEIEKQAYEGRGKLVNSGKYSELDCLEGGQEIVKDLKKKNLAEFKTTYKLRDWCVSRQRYWGPPIPMIYCQKCGWQPVPEKDLPVKLPYLSDWKPLGTGVSPLAQCKSWVKVACPECGGAARRETDVSDTFLDSAWYFFRYPSTRSGQVPFDPEITKKWLPVDVYIGGPEHTVLHLMYLMYSRFITMAFKDFGLIDFEEPYKKFFAHGFITKDGAKMSKSKGNVVIPDEYIRKFGADTLRMYLMFMGPFNQGGDFTDTGIGGIYRFLGRVWHICQSSQKISKSTSSELVAEFHRLIKKVGEDIELLKYNTAIAAMMEFLNSWSQKGSLSKKDASDFLKLLTPFAPHISEELWCEVLGNKQSFSSNKFSVHQQPWPKYDPKLIKEEMVTIVIQVNGKVRGQIEISSQASGVRRQVENLAKKEKNVAKYLAGKKIKKTIFVPGRLINFVV